jgi:hypothetical protein
MLWWTIRWAGGEAISLISVVVAFVTQIVDGNGGMPRIVRKVTFAAT